MKELLGIAAVTALALGVVGISVGAGHDTTLFVSPPEAVAEDFVRKVATGRYDRAAAHLHTTNGAEAHVKAEAESLRARAGVVTAVEGADPAIEGDMATASARIMTSRVGEIEWSFSLIRADGTWKIADWTTD